LDETVIDFLSRTSYAIERQSIFLRFSGLLWIISLTFPEQKDTVDFPKGSEHSERSPRNVHYSNTMYDQQGDTSHAHLRVTYN